MAQEEASFNDRLARFGEWTPPRPPTPPPSPNGHGPTGSNPAYVAGALDIAVTELSAMAPNSGRNHALNVAAYKLAHYHDLDREHVRSALLGACVANGVAAEDGMAQCEATFNSGWTKGRSETPTQPPAPGAHYGDSGMWMDPPPMPGGNGSGPAAAATVHDFNPEPLEGDFWERPSLTRIYDAAMLRMCSPWAVLACCAARALAWVPPCITLPPLIGPGSLNWYAAIAASSGGGKGAANALARQLVEEYVYTRNLGSGEGLITSYLSPKTGDGPGGIRGSVMFVADEIDTVHALGARTGSTLMGILRSGFTGETIGFSYATKGRDIHLQDGTYRMTLVCSVQPARAGALLGDAGGGTPQRFMWFPGVDKRITIPDNPEAQVGTLVIPGGDEFLFDRTITIPPMARDFIYAVRARRARGEADPLDGHAAFAREKFAFALAILDNRTDMSEDDWRLSGIAADVSEGTRQWVAGELGRVEQEAAQERGRLQGITNAAALVSKDGQSREYLNRVALRIERRLQEAGAAGMSKREIHNNVVRSDERGLIEPAIGGLIEWNRVRYDAEGKRWYAV